MAVAHWLEFLRAHGSIENSVTLIIPNLDFLGDLKTWIKSLVKFQENFNI